MFSDQNQPLWHFSEQTKAVHQEQDDESEPSDSSENSAEENKGVVPKVVSTSSVDPLYIGARGEEVLEECTGVQDTEKISSTPCDDHLTEGPGSHRAREGEEPVAASGSKARIAKTAALETFESSDLVVL